MDINDCQQAIDLIIKTDVFVSVLCALLLYGGITSLLDHLIKYFERRAWGDKPNFDGDGNG